MCEQSLLVCRPGDPCRVSCGGQSSCSDGTRINGLLASDVSVTCSNEDSCKSNIFIQCGTGDCVLECYGRQSCSDFGSVQTFMSRSFQCLGAACPYYVVYHQQFSLSPTNSPTMSPTNYPTKSPTKNPTFLPTISPTPPTKSPTHSPSKSPTVDPSANPTPHPSLVFVFILMQIDILFCIKTLVIFISSESHIVFVLYSMKIKSFSSIERSNTCSNN